jgi:hypothetical protein
VKIADAQHWNKEAYNNAISALRREFAFGYCDHPEQRDPKASFQSARIGKACGVQGWWVYDLLRHEGQKRTRDIAFCFKGLYRPPDRLVA